MRLLSAQDAYVEFDLSNRTWTIGNNAVAYTLGFDQSGRFVALSLRATPATGLSLIPATDTSVQLDGVRHPIGIGGDGFAYTTSSTATYGTGVRLTLVFVDRSTGIRLSRSFACYPLVPAVETWNEVQSFDPSRRNQLQQLNAFTTVITGASLGDVQWMNGLDDEAGGSGPFTWQRRTLSAGETLTLAAGARSSDRFMPWFAATSAGGAFFGGVMWSGRWTIGLQAVDGALRVDAGLATETQIDLTGSIEGPHGFFGIVNSGVDAVNAAMAGLQRALRGRRALPPVIYNTWFAYGTEIDEATLRQEAERAAALGVEIFVVDAGWYPNAGARDDFATGLGDWRADPAKFPSGLRTLSDYVHALGMKFGVWVEPERASVINIGTGRAVADAWIAEQDGHRATGAGSDAVDAVQVCFANHDVQNWAFDWLTGLIDSAGVDYLKWDNNAWIFCNRPGHGHGTHDGPFQHLSALYGLFDRLQARYPDLLVENCAGGGHRLDHGLGRRSDFGWMDDRSAPGIRVRHHAAGLGGLFAPGYLLSFVMLDPDERLSSPTETLRSVRSRMAGTLGISLKIGDLDDEARAALAREIATFKRVRDIQQDAALVRLTDQVSVAEDQAPAWDAVELVSATTGDALILAFQNDPGADSLRVRPRGLRPDAQYQVATPEAGTIDVQSGAALMEVGIVLPAARSLAAHLVTLRSR